MNEPLDELYLRWLYHQVASARVRNPARTFWTLLRKFYTTEFIWYIPNDDNRVEDGKELRYEFIDACHIQDVDIEWLEMGCSVLEMLIALSRRLSFQGEGEPRVWFWELIENLELNHYTDNGEFPEAHVEDVLNNLIWRTYDPSGRGGLFPLKYATDDQREVELWYQLSTYLLEKV